MSMLGNMFWGWSFGQIAIAIIIVAAIIAVVYVILKQLGISIPEWFVKIIWICLAAVVGVIAVKFLMSL